MMKKRKLLLMVVVGLAVILPLAFFYLSTFAVTVPQNIITPISEASNDKINKTNASTLHLLLMQNNVFGYSGGRIENGSSIKYEKLQEFIAALKSQWKDNLAVVITPAEGASYQATVDALDQMTINNIKLYELAEPTSLEKTFLQRIQE